MDDTRDLNDLIKENEEKYNSNKDRLSLLNKKYEESLDANLDVDQNLIAEIKRINIEQRKILKDISVLRKRQEELTERIKKAKGEDTEEKIVTTPSIPKDMEIQETPDAKDNDEQYYDENGNEITKEEAEKQVQEESKENEAKEEDLEATIELPKEVIKAAVDRSMRDDTTKNMKIVFDGKTGTYQINSPYTSVPKLYVVSKELLDKNNSNTKTLIEKYGENIDLNLVNALENFDREFNTNAKEKYLNNTFDGKILYDFRKFSHVGKQYLTSKDKKEIKKVAKEYSKLHENCNVVKFSNKKAAILLGAGLAAFGAATSITSTNNNDNKPNSVIEKTTEDTSTTEEIKKEEKTTEKITTEEKTTQTQTTEDKKETTEELPKEEETKKEEITVSKDEEDEKDNTKVGDMIELDSVDLYSSSSASQPAGNTENWNIPGFRIGAISVVSDTKAGSEIIKVVKDSNMTIDKILDECEQMGYDKDNIKLSFLIEALDENGNVMNNQLGWVKQSDLKNDNVAKLK